MVMVKATKKSEAGVMPTDPGFQKLMEQMGKFNEELVKAGVILAADGLHPSSRGKRVYVSPSGEQRTVVERAVHRDQGAHRRLLDLAGEVGRGGCGMGHALPATNARRRGADRDSPDHRG
jgi:hypothetical protein